MNYTINNKVILRTPKNSFDLFINKTSADEIEISEEFNESLYLASPSLYETSLRKINKSDVEPPALLNYLSRSCFRCTPFGLFAGLSVVEFNEKTELIFSGKKRFTRLDMDYHLKLIDHLRTVPLINNAIVFFSNNSIYKTAGKLRYIEYELKNNKRHYAVSEVTYSKELRKILNASNKGATLSSLVELITDNNTSKDDAQVFIKALVQNQLLVSELQPAITGNQLTAQLAETLSKIKGSNISSEIVEYLNKINYSINQLDQRENNHVQHYKEIVQMVKNFGAPFEENKLFQVDLFKTTIKNSLSNEIKTDLLKAIEILSKLSSIEHTKLDNFKSRFNERYGSKEIPLLEVLDENGLGYPEVISGSTSLISDIQLTDLPTKNIILNDVTTWLFKKLQHALLNNNYVVNIEWEELTRFESLIHKLPASFSIVFKVTDFKTNTLYIEGIGGSSATQMAGRFAYADNDIKNLACDIAASEQNNNPNVVYAEIVHLPESRTGNVIIHPPFYRYEIPFLTKSSLPVENQIPLQDLYVSLSGNYLKLYSKKLNKEIIPRLSNAHNYGLSELPVYKFLCDIQHQETVANFTFNWGELTPEFVFLPRVTHNNIILHLATWKLIKKEWEALDENHENFVQHIKTFQDKWHFPRYVVLADADKELFIDFENTRTVKSFLQSIATREKVIIKELLFDPESPVIDTDGKKYINQFVASVMRSDSAASNQRSNKTVSAAKKVRRTFLPGSEWLYFKYYCGTKTADSVLTAVINLLTKKLLKDGLITSWFFVRYKDTDTNLRVRYHLKNEEDFGVVLKIHNSFFKRSFHTGQVWKTEMATYERELERYGKYTMDLSETIFFHDSDSILNLLKVIRHERDELRWLWGIKAIDELLNNFSFTTKEKLKLLLDLKNSFAAEFSLSKNSKFQMDLKYRKYKTDIESVLSEGNILPAAAIKILGDKTKKIAITVNEIKLLHQNNTSSVSLEVLIQSHVHMLLNGLIPHSQRLHEMIIYDFMCRQYHSRLRRSDCL